MTPYSSRPWCESRRAHERCWTPRSTQREESALSSPGCVWQASKERLWRWLPAATPTPLRIAPCEDSFSFAFWYDADRCRAGAPVTNLYLEADGASAQSIV